jgi:hypothetical protein
MLCRGNNWNPYKTHKYTYTVRSEIRCSLTKTSSSIESTIVSKNLIQQLHTPVLHFNRC